MRGGKREGRGVVGEMRYGRGRGWTKTNLSSWQSAIVKGEGVDGGEGQGYGREGEALREARVRS